jgi:hypothetical protein
VDVQRAIDNFDTALVHCDNIVQVHRAHGGGARGRRTIETSLDRAVIVLAVAAWQAAVQDLTSAILDTARPTGPTPLDVARYDTMMGPVRKAIGDFATPNAEKSRDLMVSAGFDPRPSWTYTIAGGQGRAPVTWTPHMVGQRLNEWLRLRHAVAHGHDELPVVQALEAVRLNGVTSDPTLRLTDAEQCMSFVNRLVRLTSSSVAAHLGVTVTYPRP